LKPQKPLTDPTKEKSDSQIQFANFYSKDGLTVGTGAKFSVDRNIGWNWRLHVLLCLTTGAKS
jgi:hypothetical protein